jgi:hypothetical protein
MSEDAVEHLRKVSEFNLEDLHWTDTGRWDHITTLDKSMWHDPNVASAEAARRIEQAWQLARTGSGFWLQGHVALFGNMDMVSFTPYSVRLIDDFGTEEFSAEARNALNAGNKFRPRLQRVV